jgi:hypothetical protein|eukprot:COSAG01_NODE_28683_length_655_cov_1.537770_2_plen_90_part_00
MIHFFLMVNKHGQTRLADYFTKCGTPLRCSSLPAGSRAPSPTPCCPLPHRRTEGQTVESRAAEEAEIVRKCLARKDNQVGVVAPPPRSV